MTAGCSFHSQCVEGEHRAEITPQFEARKLLMQRLAKAMVWARGQVDEKRQSNPRLPAGYTYLGQFIAHDISFNSTQKTSFPTSGATASSSVADFRAPARLDLDSLYGAGPEFSTALYSRERNTSARWRLNLHISQVYKNRKKVSKDGEIVEEESENAITWDLPRVRLFENQFPAIEVAADPRPATAVVADPRNDSHLLIAQLTVLFARFHNQVAKSIKEKIAPDITQPEAFKIFPIAKRMVCAAYRIIILEDFLMRLLDDDIHKQLTGAVRATTFQASNLITPFSITYGDQAAPPAFSVAAFRIGHAMARGKYSLSKFRRVEQSTDGSKKPDHSAATLHELIAIHLDIGKRLPSFENWTVEWDRFFFDSHMGRRQMEDSKGKARNYSSRILPWAPDAIEGQNANTNLRAQDGGGAVIYRDLVRNSVGNLSCAEQFVREHFPHLPGKLFLTKEQRKVALKKNFGKCPDLSDDGAYDDIDQLATHTPLILYLLLEAQSQHGGRRLGTVGSHIVGDVLVRTIIASDHDTQLGVRDWQTYLDTPPPKTMPELLKDLQRRENS